MRRNLLLMLVATGIAVGGCGGSSKPANKSANQLTMAQVCATHPSDVGKIAAGIFAFKFAMEHADMASLSSVSGEVREAISELQSAAVGATSSNLPAMRSLLQSLGQLSETMIHTPTFPTAIVGDKRAEEIEGEAREVGCKF